MLKELYCIFLELFRRQGISISNLISGLCIMLVRLISGITLILDYSFLWLNRIPSHEHVLIYLFSYSGTISFFLSFVHVWFSEVLLIPLRNANRFPHPHTVNGRAWHHPGPHAPRLWCLGYSAMPWIFKVSSSRLWKDVFCFLLSRVPTLPK